MVIKFIYEKVRKSSVKLFHNILLEAIYHDLVFLEDYFSPTYYFISLTWLILGRLGLLITYIAIRLRTLKETPRPSSAIAFRRIVSGIKWSCDE